MLTLGTTMYAQMRLDDRMKVDTLTWKDRIALRTNAIDWLLLQANLGVEIDLGAYNYNRWTLLFSGKINWATPHTFTPEWVYDIIEAKVEVRNYWRTHAVEGNYFAEHTTIIDKLFSQRRRNPKYRLPAYYRGFYVALDKFDMRIPVLVDQRHDGKAIQAGFTYGIVKPLYVYRNGSSIDLDLGISAGIAVQNSQTSTYNVDNTEFRIDGEYSGWSLVKMPVINELRASLVYRPGKYHMTSRYRRRYDVDIDYMNFNDSIFIENERIAYTKHVNDSTFNAVRTYYQLKVDSLVKQYPDLAKPYVEKKDNTIRRPADIVDGRLKTTTTNAPASKADKRRKEKEARKGGSK